MSSLYTFNPGVETILTSPSGLRDKLEILWKNRELWRRDVEVRYSNKIFQLDSLLVVESSGFFRRVLAGKTGGVTKIDLTGQMISRSSLEEAIRFMYHGHFSVQKATLAPILYAAHFLQMDEMQRILELYISRLSGRKEELGFCLKIATEFPVSSILGEELLARSAFLFPAVSRDPYFSKLPLPCLKELLNVAHLGSMGRQEVRDALEPWKQEHKQDPPELDSILDQRFGKKTSSEDPSPLLDTTQGTPERTLTEMNYSFETVDATWAEPDKTQAKTVAYQGFLEYKHSEKEEGMGDSSAHPSVSGYLELGGAGDMSSVYITPTSQTSHSSP